ncbi:hypothetical protein [Streptomyces sp. WAC01280]|uniref:hypothetical protein n=1 Tax=Streptomyces sp. WAC01280 TaxID=2487424 RepID=UPI000F798277|nr:hypothetical protein [Streptomyces sp. WAC01280]RSS59562.1 hypothetical protein EF909_06705 [Streptomyces sp. WAC01280]
MSDETTEEAGAPKDVEAVYKRRWPADTDPTTLAGQQASIEGAVAAAGLTPVHESAAARTFREGMASLIADYERAHQAEIREGNGNGDYLDFVRSIAIGYEGTADDPKARHFLLDDLAESLSLSDIRALRVAGEAAVAATPRVIQDDAKRGTKPKRIADEVGLSLSRVYQILRDE